MLHYTRRMAGQLPFRDYSITPIVAFVLLTAVVVRGDVAETLTQPWFLGVGGLLAVSAGADLWRMRRQKRI